MSPSHCTDSQPPAPRSRGCALPWGAWCGCESDLLGQEEAWCPALLSTLNLGEISELTLALNSQG